MKIKYKEIKPMTIVVAKAKIAYALYMGYER
jgi:hypothetical protein